jgi:hypothetical protein
VAISHTSSAGLFALKEACHDKHRYHQRRPPGSITPRHRSPPASKGTAVFAAKAANLGRMATPDLDTHLGPALPGAALLGIHGKPTILGADRGDQPAIVVF